MPRGAAHRPPPSDIAARLAHPGAPDPFAQPALQPHPALDWDAVRRGDARAVEASLRARGASVNALQLRADGDRTALHTAALHGHEPLVALLLRMRADPTIRADCRAGRLAPPVAEGPVRLRSKPGGEPRATSDVQRAQTALELATMAGHVEVATLLRVAMGLPPLRPAHRTREMRARAALDADAEAAARAAESAQAPPPPPARAASGAAAPAAREPAAAGEAVPREARPKLAQLLNPAGVPSWQPADGLSNGRRAGADAQALFDGLALKPALTAAQRADWAAVERERRAAEEDGSLRAREGIDAQRGGHAGGHTSHEAGARELRRDVLVTRAEAPVGGVRERTVDRWR